MNECDYCQRCGRRLTEPCGCKPRDELFYDPASAVWSGVDRAKPGTDRTTLVVHTPNGKDDPLYLKLAEQCIKHGWVILRMEDDGRVYDDMLGSLGEDRTSVGVVPRVAFSQPMDPNEWPEYPPMTAEQRAEYEQATREKARGTWLLSDDILHGAYLKPRSARALLEYQLERTSDNITEPLIRGEIGKVLGVTVHKAPRIDFDAELHKAAERNARHHIRRREAENRRNQQAELAKIRKRKEGY